MLQRSDKFFETTLIKILESSEKEANIDAQMENFIRDKEYWWKLKSWELKKMVSEMNNSIDWLIRRLEAAVGRINILEDELMTLVEITQTKHKGERKSYRWREHERHRPLS